ncbi:MAG: SOS response-associated peptidase family protein [Parasporobacterium sp.]|nr:SOS response-associated peptidase family protein [Parasporobacterium sp.]
MCTRYYLDNEDPILKTITEEMEKSPLCGRFLLETGRKFTTSGEVFPTDIVPVIAPNKNGERAVFPMRWGFRLADGTPLYNARTETAAVKPFFREDWKRHRCIVPASWYFEWQHGYKRSPEEEKNAISNSNPILRKDEIRKEASGKYAIQPAVRGRCQFRSCKIRCFVFRHCEFHKSCLL